MAQIIQLRPLPKSEVPGWLRQYASLFEDNALDNICVIARGSDGQMHTFHSKSPDLFAELACASWMVQYLAAKVEVVNEE